MEKIKFYDSNQDISTYMFRVLNGDMVNYCYLVVDNFTRESVLIDPAWDIDTIRDAIVACGAKLNGILITHHHLDHVNLAEQFSNIYNIDVYISEEEIKTYNLSFSKMKPFQPGLIANIGKVAMISIHTPGHTKGSYCFLIGDNLFTGDTLFIEGCGICFGKGANPYELFDSLLKLKKIIPKHTRIFPGHRYESELGQYFTNVLLNNPYLNIDDNETFVNFRMRNLSTGQKEGILNFM